LNQNNVKSVLGTEPENSLPKPHSPEQNPFSPVRYCDNNTIKKTCCLRIALCLQISTSTKSRN
ncbi:hypothetical protein ACFMPY_004726, partial [Escherichia coli]